MTDRDIRICTARAEGVTVPRLSEIWAMSAQNVQRIIYSPDGKQLVERLKREKNSRSDLSAPLRVGKLMDRVIGALEEKMDESKSVEERIALGKQIAELSKQVGDVPDTESDHLPVVVLPATLSIEAFNERRTLEEKDKGPSPNAPTGGSNNQDGSKMSTPVHIDETPYPSPVEDPAEDGGVEEVSSEDRWGNLDEEMAGSLGSGERW